MEIYKTWSARALKDCLNGLGIEMRYSQQLEECIDTIVEEIATISEERGRSESV